MPLYEFKCEKCGEVREHLVKSSDEQPTCPACGAKALTRLLSTFAVSVASANSSPMPQCATGQCEMASSCSSGMCGLQ